MRRLLISVALLCAGSAQAGELATCDALQKRYGDLVLQQQSDTWFAHAGAVTKRCPSPITTMTNGVYSNGSDQAWINYDVCKRQPATVTAANAAAQQVVNAYRQPMATLSAALSSNNCP